MFNLSLDGSSGFDSLSDGMNPGFTFRSMGNYAVEVIYKMI